jgi:hypothetical protein
MIRPRLSLFFTAGALWLQATTALAGGDEPTVERVCQAEEETLSEKRPDCRAPEATTEVLAVDTPAPIAVVESPPPAAATPQGAALIEPPGINNAPSAVSARPTPPLRGGSRFGLGGDFSFVALAGFPSLMVEYAVDPALSLGGAIRFPLSSATELVFEPHLYFFPRSPISPYAGGSFGAMYGDVDTVLRQFSPDSAPFSARSASVIGPLAGVQIIDETGAAFYIEASYLWATARSDDGTIQGWATLPNLAIGYRVFF